MDDVGKDQENEGRWYILVRSKRLLDVTTGSPVYRGTIWVIRVPMSSYTSPSPLTLPTGGTRYNVTGLWFVHGPSPRVVTGTTSESLWPGLSCRDTRGCTNGSLTPFKGRGPLGCIHGPEIVVSTWVVSRLERSVKWLRPPPSTLWQS